MVDKAFSSKKLSYWVSVVLWYRKPSFKFMLQTRQKAVKVTTQIKVTVKR